MPRRLLTLALLVVALTAAGAQAATASDTFGGGSGTTKSTGASTGDGSITVTVGIHHHPGSVPTSTSIPPTTGDPGSNSDSTTTTDPITCTIEPVNLLQFQELLGPGPNGETGYWAIDKCTGPNGPVPHPPVFVAVAQPGTPATPGTQTLAAPPPVVVAQQASKQLDLPNDGIEMAPPTSAPELVNVSTWLWLDPATWKPYTATATIDGVSATATATPEKVVWSMGDGNSITCSGPGTPYNPSQPNATTDCSYTWTQPSDAEPGGVYQVTATTEWSVTWTAVGAAGGGNLGIVAGPANHAVVKVTESQAINTPANQSTPSPSGAGGS